MLRFGRLSFTFVALVLGASSAHAAGPRFEVTYPADKGPGPFDGRVLVVISKDDSAEPRFQISDTGLKTQQIFGIDVDGPEAGQRRRRSTATSSGFPLESLARRARRAPTRCRPLLHKYETFRRADGHVVKLPMDRGEGQQWNTAPGNLYSTPRKVDASTRRATRPSPSRSTR